MRDDVRRDIEDLAPGGGFVFAAVHNSQGNVPPKNIMAMWETLQEYGIYAPPTHCPGGDPVARRSANGADAASVV